MLAHWFGWNWLSVANLLALCGVTALLLTSPQFQVTQVIIAREAESGATLAQAHELSNVVGREHFPAAHGAAGAGDRGAAQRALGAGTSAAARPDYRRDRQARAGAVWQAVNGAFLVDREGQVIGPATDGTPDRPVMVIHETSGVERWPGQRIERRILLAARELRRALPELEIDPQAIEYGTLGLTVVGSNGWRIIFGELEQFNAKLENLAAILDLQRRQPEPVEVIDLRPVERPYYRLIPTPTPPGAVATALPTTQPR